MGRTRILGENVKKSKGHYSETNKEGTLILVRDTLP